MALSDDQRAMLRLLAQREEGYEDIAALLGLSVAEVRARVKEALTELDGPAEGPGPAAAAPAPPPTEPTPVEEPPPPTEAPLPPAEPEPEQAPPSPEPPPPPAQAHAAPRQPSPGPSRRPRNLPSWASNRRRLLEIGGAALVALLLVLFATGAIDLEGGDSGSDSGSTTAATTTAAEGKVTGAVLSAPGGGGAGGRATFGRVGKGPVLQVEADGLEPSAEGESYAVWLYRSPKLALRVGAVKVEKSGQIGVQFPVPVELLSYVAGGAFDQIYVSRVDDASYKTEIAQAKKQKRLPAYSGETVLNGPIAGPLIQR